MLNDHGLEHVGITGTDWVEIATRWVESGTRWVETGT